MAESNIQISLSEQDLELIAEWSKNHDLKCLHCNSRDFIVPGSLSFLSYFDLKTKRLNIDQGHAIIPKYCSSCGTLILLMAHKVLPHYFK